MKRLFIALPVPEPLSRSFRESVEAFLQSLRRREIGHRVPSFGNDHLTLAFLGPLDAEKESLAIEALRELGGEARFDLRWKDLDSFPNRRSARVAFAGFEPEPRLTKLYERLRGALHARGFAIEDRAYVPHLTIARLTRPANLDCALDSEWRPESLPPLPVDRVVLYESRPGPRGSAYLEVQSINLAQIPPT